MMMAQYIVEDQGTSVPGPPHMNGVIAYPTPTTGRVAYHAPFTVEERLVLDAQGRTIAHDLVSSGPSGTIDLEGALAGPYVLWLRSGERTATTVLIKE